MQETAFNPSPDLVHQVAFAIEASLAAFNVKGASEDELRATAINALNAAFTFANPDQCS